MKEYLIFLWFLGLSTIPVFAQQENIWMLGSFGLDFNSPSLTAPAMNGQQFGEASASVCDDNGQLLFYTEGSRVWDRFHDLMPNGTALTTVAPNATGSSTQGACIVPIPGQDHQYYVFSVTSVEFGMGKLFYSKVDMTLNSGKGDVVTGQKAIYLGEGFTEKLIALTGTRCNIWVIVRSRLANEFKSYEVTSSGVNPNPVTSTTGIINFNYHILGTLTPSPDNKKVLCAAAHVGGGGLELFDFGQATGLLSSLYVIDSSEPFYSACFSADQSKIYAINYWYTGAVYQYDLSAPNPFATKTIIRQAPEFNFDKIKLAADGKVYLKGGANYLDAVNFPNLAAPACNYTTNAVSFSANSISGALPNIVPVFIQEADTFSVTQVEGPCWSHGFELQGAIGGWDYQSNGAHQGPVITVDTPGLYWLSYYTGPCRFHVDTFFVTFPKGVLPDITVQAACKESATGKARATTYPGDPVYYTYIWFKASGQDTLSVTDSLTGREAGSYKVFITTNTGCDTVLYFDIPAITPEVSFALSDTLICVSDALFTTNTSDAHFTSFLWSFGDGNTSSAFAPGHNYTLPGTYRIVLVGRGSTCIDTSFINVTADTPAQDFRFSVNRYGICIGEQIKFVPDSDSTLMQLFWDFGDGASFTTAAPDSVQHAYDRDGTMWISFNAQFRACPDISYRDSVMVYPLPLVYLGQDDTLCLDGAPVILTNLAPPASESYHLRWSTGDTTTSLKVVHPGTYQLQVIANLSGCAGTESITVQKDCYTDIPNAFTPNGDGYNDYFFPRQYLSKGVATFKFILLNRWGQIIFETRNSNGRGWDGRFNQKDQPGGVYIYLMEVSFYNGKTETYKGSVTLVR
ncbi:MAG: PKD domain-containing protein [Taibaiella sp.]|jgi:gliding motility-associated-like protein